MIKVALVTRWASIDGDVEYARNLKEYVEAANEDMKLDIFPAPFRPYELLQSVAEYNVVFFNFVFGAFDSVKPPGVLSRFGKKRVVLTFHENNPSDTAGNHPFLRECAQVIVHEKNSHGFVFIPHGVPVVKPCLWSEKNTSIGTAGFPFADKRVPMIAEAAAQIVQQTDRIRSCTIAACHSGNADSFAVKRQVLSHFPSTVYLTDFLEQGELLKVLSSNLVNVFIPNSRRLGPSGSVRLGLATGSHIVLSRSAMFRDLEEYSDEIEWVDGSSDQTNARRVTEAVLRVLQSGKRPSKILADQSWERSAKLYADVFRSCL